MLCFFFGGGGGGVLKQLVVNALGLDPKSHWVQVALTELAC